MIDMIIIEGSLSFNMVFLENVRIKINIGDQLSLYILFRCISIFKVYN